ncbi:type II toxin-antitoxin system RelE/ParE family toxin [Photorhabdus stackebrandtii]|uniref:Type II toxin-antitoxin system RelE/ParE family toxin n=1 Tax=Photorhabdus stackebrandtii TaxID=1123042 RepID=A0A7X5QP88_9GAMM|nr:type II toxin-antitoxin system RelE/ParE family toxin [Photorhabdus stackebrandtii]NHB98003.1 type II toxin-antitoxin system RelE/ParE family toxin [Photorhabdus stackebrandtii]
MKYTIDYYNDSVRADIDRWPITLRVRYAKLTERMKEFGGSLGEPHTSAFGNGLFELRVKGGEGIGRVFFCTIVDKRIVILHSFIKKTQKTPSKERTIAEARLKEIKKNDW